MDRIVTSKVDKHFFKNSGFHEEDTSESDYTDFFQRRLYDMLEKELIDPPVQVVLRILDISKRTR